MNIVATADGRIGSLDLRALTDNRIKEFGAYFQAVLADELRRLGIQVGYDENEQAVVIERPRGHRPGLQQARQADPAQSPDLRGAPGAVVG